MYIFFLMFFYKVYTYCITLQLFLMHLLNIYLQKNHLNKPSIMKRNVLLGCLLLMTYFASGQTLINETFSGSTFPPAAWTTEGNSGHWDLDNNNWAGGTAPEAGFSWSPIETGLWRLVSLPVNTTGASKLNLNFKHRLFWLQSNIIIGVATRTGSGPWTSVWEVNATNSIPAQTESFPIQNSDVGQNNFEICFYINGNTDNIDGWFIDDVVLSVALNHDVRVSSIILKKYFAVNETVIAQTNVENIGSSQETFPVKCDIFDPYNNLVFSNTQTVTSLPVNSIQTVTFNSYIPVLPSSNYHLKITTMLSGDQNTANDTMSCVFKTLAPEDLVYEDFCQGIMPPNGGWTIDNNPQAWGISISNNSGGTEPEGNLYYTPSYTGTQRFISPLINTSGKDTLLIRFKTYLSFYQNMVTIGVATRHSGLAWNIIWSKDISTNLPAELEEIYFSNGDVGASDFQFCIFFSGDNDDINVWDFDDILLSAPYAHDAMALSVEGTSNFTPNASYTPIGNVKNVGYTTESFNVQCRILDHTGASLYNNIQTTSNLAIGETQTMTFNPFILSIPNESYKVQIITQMTADMNPGNDTATRIINTYTTSRSNVLMEVGTGTWCSYCPSAAQGVDDLLANGKKVAVVEYHDNDDYTNTASTARLAYYWIIGYPTAIFDGTQSLLGGNASNSMYPAYLPLYEMQDSVKTPIYMEIGVMPNGSDLSITANAFAITPIFYTDLSLFIAVTESHIPENWQGMNELNFVERAMLPDHNGTPIDLVNHSNVTVNQILAPDPSWNLDNIEFVAWVQNTVTKEVFNSVKFPYSMVGIGGKKNHSGTKIYPNPVRDVATISFTMPHSGYAKVEILNPLGEPVKIIYEGQLDSGLQKITWNGDASSHKDLPNGIYFCRIITEKESSTIKLILNK